MGRLPRVGCVRPLFTCMCPFRVYQTLTLPACLSARLPFSFCLSLSASVCLILSLCVCLSLCPFLYFLYVHCLDLHCIRCAGNPPTVKAPRIERRQTRRWARITSRPCPSTSMCHGLVCHGPVCRSRLPRPLNVAQGLRHKDTDCNVWICIFQSTKEFTL